MYTVEINYQTGNSFGSEDLTETVGPVWEDKNLARKALKTIKEHYQLYEELDQSEWFRKRPVEEAIKELKSKEWFQKYDGYGDKNSDNKYDLGYMCAVEMDDGTWRNLDVNMWCGYFERLHGADVVCEQDDEDSFRL